MQIGELSMGRASKTGLSWCNVYYGRPTQNTDIFSPGPFSALLLSALDTLESARPRNGGCKKWAKTLFLGLVIKGRLITINYPWL